MTAYEAINAGILLVGIIGIYLKLQGISRNEIHSIITRLAVIEQRLAWIEGKLDKDGRSGKIRV